MSRCTLVTSGPMSESCGAVADLQRPGALGDLGHQLVGDRADGHRRRDRHAALTGRAEAGVDHGVGGEVEVGVGQDHRVVLRAAEGLDALAVQRAGRVDVLRDRGGADERDGLDRGVGQQLVDGDLVALQDVEDAGGQAGLGPQVGDPQRGRRVLLATA